MASNSSAREQRFKAQAERLREFLAAAGVDLKHTTSLQALAHMHKAQDWRALLASPIEPEAESTSTPTKFITLTVVADSASLSAAQRHRIALRVDQVASYTEIPSETNGGRPFFGNPKAFVHLTEPADWESEGETDADDNPFGGGVVRAYRKLCVRESFDEISTMLGVSAPT